MSLSSLPPLTGCAYQDPKTNETNETNETNKNNVCQRGRGGLVLDYAQFATPKKPTTVCLLCPLWESGRWVVPSHDEIGVALLLRMRRQAVNRPLGLAAPVSQFRPSGSPDEIRGALRLPNRQNLSRCDLVISPGRSRTHRGATGAHGSLPLLFWPSQSQALLFSDESTRQARRGPSLPQTPPTPTTPRHLYSACCMLGLQAVRDVTSTGGSKGRGTGLPHTRPSNDESRRSPIILPS